TEWSYHLIQDNDPAKQELSQRVRNSVESFVKSHIDSNFILPLPNDEIDSNVECTETLFENNVSTHDNNIAASPSSSLSIVESVITPMMSNIRLSTSEPKGSEPQTHNQIRRSLSDNYEKSDKIKKTGLEPIIHDDHDSDLIANESQDNNYVVTEENFCYNLTEEPDSNNLPQTLNDSSVDIDPFNIIQQSNSRHDTSRDSEPIISPIPLTSSSNPFISPSEVIDSNINNMTQTTSNIDQIRSLGFTEEFVVVLDDGDIVVDENNHCLDDQHTLHDHINDQQQTTNDDDVISNNVEKDNSSISNIDQHDQQTNNNTATTATTSQTYLI
ncbi:hypothetical protein BLA29_007227, partial [Euroglyphus maynei]